jgi:hypothetical protein
MAELRFNYNFEGISYTIDLHFNYSRGTSTIDRNTLTYISVDGVPQK